jgi:hypothetical protein
MARTPVPFGDNTRSVTTDILSEGDFAIKRFIWTRELQPNSRRNPSFHSLLFGLSPEQNPEPKRHDSHRAEEYHDGINQII